MKYFEAFYRHSKHIYTQKINYNLGEESYIYAHTVNTSMHWVISRALHHQEHHHHKSDKCSTGNTNCLQGAPEGKKQDQIRKIEIKGNLQLHKSGSKSDSQTTHTKYLKLIIKGDETEHKVKQYICMPYKGVRGGWEV